MTPAQIRIPIGGRCFATWTPVLAANPIGSSRDPRRSTTSTGSQTPSGLDTIRGPQGSFSWARLLDHTEVQHALDHLDIVQVGMEHRGL